MRPLRGTTCVLVIALLLGGAAACEGGADEAPASTVRRFLELMERSGSDAAATEEAYALLDAATRRELQQRADRARSLSGREVPPHQMLVAGSFRLRFAPVTPGGFQAEVQGDRATVTVRGRGQSERAKIPLVREGGRWRIELSLPATAHAPRQPAP